MTYTETTTETTTELIEPILVDPIDTFEQVKIVAAAAEDKKASDVTVLKLIGVTTFTDYFVICSANSSRQVQSISEEIEGSLRSKKIRPLHVEGRTNAEWILMDYGTFIVHVFNEKSRQFYDLERLWRDAEKVELSVQS